MRLPFVSRAAFADVCAEHDRLVKDNARLRAERDQFADDRDIHKGNAIRATRELAEARATIRRLTGRIDELVRRDAEAADTEQVAELRRQLAHVQARHDDAVGLNDPAIELAGARAKHDRLNAPKEDAS